MLSSGPPWEDAGGYVGACRVAVLMCWWLRGVPLTRAQECESTCVMLAWESPKSGATLPPWPGLVSNF